MRFRETIEALHDDGARVFIEAGPRGNMTSFMQDILRGRPACAVAADVRRRSGTAQLNHLVGMLAVHDVELDLGYLFAQRDVHDDRLARSSAPGRATAAGREIALSTTWPMLRLPEEALEQLRTPSPLRRDGPAAHGASANGSRPPLARRARRPRRRRPCARSRTTPAHAASRPLGRPRRAQRAQPLAAPWPVPRGRDEDEPRSRSRATSRRCSTSWRPTSEVMSAYLGGGRGGRARAGARGRCVGHDRRLGARAASSWRSGWSTPPRTATCSTTRSAGASRARDPELHALALMPLAMSIEILAEAACLPAARA